jgi:hypothetical protein
MGIAAIISLLGPFLPTIILGVQKVFGVAPPDKPDVNTTKLQTVLNTVMMFLNGLAAVGKTPGTVVPAEVEAAIEAVLAAMKQSGQVPSNSIPSMPTTLGSGAVMQISGTVTIK